MTLKEHLRAMMAQIIVNAIDKRISGQEIVQYIDEYLDKNFGQEYSSKFQQGFFNNLLFEMIDGIYPNKLFLIQTLRNKADELEADNGN